MRRVTQGSAADRGGLARGDTVQRINGVRTTSLAEAREPILNAFFDDLPLGLTGADGKEVTVPAIEKPARSLPVHPTQVYSAINAGLLSWLLWCS